MGGIDVANRLGSDQSGRGMADSGWAIRFVDHYAADHQQVSNCVSVGLRGACALGDSVDHSICSFGRVDNLCSNVAIGRVVSCSLSIHVVD